MSSRLKWDPTACNVLLVSNQTIDGSATIWIMPLLGSVMTKLAISSGGGSLGAIKIVGTGCLCAS